MTRKSRESALSLLDSALGEPQDRRTIAQHVAGRLRTFILNGTLPPGTPLRVNPLAERLGHSAMPVRDALRLLEVERLVEVVPRHGAVVATLSEDDIEEIYGTRAALEAICARRATERAGEEDLAELEVLFKRMEESACCGDLEAFGVADRAFHDLLYTFADRPRVVKTISELVARGRRYTALGWTHRGLRPLADSLEEHRRLYEAVVARDAKLAHELTRQHLEQAGERLLVSVRQMGNLPTS
jgi:DNA-binding GntR family transcriptional regulator